MKKIAFVSKRHLIAFLLLSFIHAQAQDKIKYGRVPIEDLKMKTYAQDSTAHAVVLYDKGFLEGNTNLFTRHIRIKILQSAGSSYANFQIRTTSKSDINGITYNLENGLVHETPLTNDNIFKEEIIDGNYLYKIFFPGVKVGCIIDLRYFFYGLPREWRFQERIPVLYNELVLDQTPNLLFKKTMFGTQVVSNKGNKWIATNVPAFVEEPYMCHYSNYLTHFKIDIQEFSIPGRYYKEISSTWEKIASNLMDYKYFGVVLHNAPFLNEKASEIKNSKQSLHRKTQAAYNYIQENIKWNGWSTVFATEGYWANFKKNHAGNSAEVNLLLIALLQKAGITTYPVVMSTRDNGLLSPISASLTSLNYVVAYVKMDSLDLFLDATDPELVPGMLPVRCRNISAYVIDLPAGWWLDTSLGKANTRRQYIQVKPDIDGEFIAEVTNTHEDYNYLEWIKNFKEIGSEEAYIRSVTANTTDLQIKNCSISVDKAKLKATETRTVSLRNTDYVQDLGNEVIINPFIFNDIANPFKHAERHYPVDFIFPQKRSIIVTIKVPDGYILRKTPEDMVITADTGGAKFSFMSSITNSVLSIRCNLQIDKQIFDEQEYPTLRNFFIEVNRKISESIQIDKKKT
ncbi:MAG: hypothetical protein ABIR06_20295 [Cyclobacteriaceae bacterium]